MRRIVAGLFISLDGVTQDPQNWQMGLMDAEAGADVGRGMEEADTILLGRRTYEEFAAYWPSAPADDPFSSYINSTPLTTGWHSPAALTGVRRGWYDSLQHQLALSTIEC